MTSIYATLGRTRSRQVGPIQSVVACVKSLSGFPTASSRLAVALRAPNVRDHNVMSCRNDPSHTRRIARATLIVPQPYSLALLLK